MKITFGLLFILPLLFSCTQNLFVTKTPSSNALTDSVFARNSGYEYRIQRDDKISVSIWDHDDWSVGSLYGIYNSNETSDPLINSQML